nr:hypothetical protein [Nitrospirota bacterium]
MKTNMRTRCKAAVAKIPWLLEFFYMVRAAYRHSFLDKIVMDKYRKRNPVPSEIMTLVSKLDRDGFVVLGNYFSENDLKSILAERDEIVSRVASNDVDKKDLKVGSSGTYRLHWSTSYGPLVDKLFFSNSLFESVAKWYLGGDVTMEYKLFQRSLPLENELFGISGFHFDYVWRTFKVFLYVTDVPADNGPFVYCPQTTALTVEKLRKIAHMYQINNNKALYYSKEEEEPLKLSEHAIPLTGSKGTVLLV